MNNYKVTISITDGEEEIKQDFYVEADSFDEAINKVENDLNITLK